MIQSLYNRFIRHRLPKKYGVFNGVTVKRLRLLDMQDELPEYESETADGIHEHVQKGDSVVIIGGGWGVSTVHAARATGEDGCVTVFEGSRSQVESIEHTERINHHPSSVRIENRVVGPPIDVYGEPGESLSVSELPKAEVLILDCEGSERDILRELEVHPRVIIAESHPFNGVSVDDVTNEIDNHDYNIEWIKPGPEATNPTVCAVRR